MSTPSPTPEWGYFDTDEWFDCDTFDDDWSECNSGPEETMSEIVRAINDIARLDAEPRPSSPIASHLEDGEFGEQYWSDSNDGGLSDDDGGGSPPTITHDTRRGVAVVLLGLHYRPESPLESDTIRVDALVGFGYNVLTASEAPSTSTRHLDVNFKLKRGIESLISYLSGVSNMIVLDYFWLQEGYYNTRYGTNWAKKVSLLFGHPETIAVLLPDDKYGEMSKMRDGDSGIDKYFTVLELDKAKSELLNPLVFATVACKDELYRIDHTLYKGRNHEGQWPRLKGYCAIFRCEMTHKEAWSFLESFARYMLYAIRCVKSSSFVP